MSVYRPQKSRYFQYDFTIKGRRFHGSTGVETRRAAESVERKLRQDAALGLLDNGAQMTLDLAAGKWWAEVGQHLGTAADLERRIGIVLRLLGKNTRLIDVSTKDISAAIQRRRGESFAKSRAKGAKRYPVANATVNADIIGVLRRIMRRAATAWGMRGLAAIDWKSLRLDEPSPEIRVYTAAQEQAWLDACDDVSRFALRILLTYGLRLNELFFAPDAFDPAGPRLALHKRKRDVPHMIPLREDDGRQVAARAGRALAAGLSCIWFEQNEWGKLVTVTYYGLQARLRTAARRAGLTLPRMIHGARHHAGTTSLRNSKNLKVTQQLLGHVSLSSTMRYAHALEDDVRAAVEGESRNSPEPGSSDIEFVVPKQRRRRG